MFLNYLRTLPTVKFSKFSMVSLKGEVSNGKISLEFVLTALPVLQAEIQV